MKCCSCIKKLQKLCRNATIFRRIFDKRLYPRLSHFGYYSAFQMCKAQASRPSLRRLATSPAVWDVQRKPRSFVTQQSKPSEKAKRVTLLRTLEERITFALTDYRKGRLRSTSAWGESLEDLRIFQLSGLQNFWKMTSAKRIREIRDMFDSQGKRVRIHINSYMYCGKRGYMIKWDGEKM